MAAPGAVLNRIVGELRDHSPVDRAFGRRICLKIAVMSADEQAERNFSGATVGRILRDMASFLKILLLTAAFALAWIVGNVFGHV